MRRKPYVTTGALFMGLIVILGVMGIVNGLWSKNLVINGSVATGDLNADWDCGYTNDDGQQLVIQGTHPCPDTVTEPAGDTGADPFGSFPPFPYATDLASHRKDVAECNLVIGQKDAAGKPTGFLDQVATITVHNAYPSYECTATMFLSNTGSIPFNIIGSKLTPGDPAGGIETPKESCTFDLTDPQVDPNEEKKIECIVHVLQTALQNTCTGVTTNTNPVTFPSIAETCTNSPLTTYKFGIEVCVAQWNEAASFDQCKGSPQHEGPGPEVGVQGVTPVCIDTLDNDLDGLVDAADPGCVLPPPPGP